MDWKLTRFDEVAWYSCPREPRGYALACVSYQDEVRLPFADAMAYWVVLKDGFLWEWLGEAWSRASEPKRDWHQVRDWMSDQMWMTWRTQP